MSDALERWVLTAEAQATLDNDAYAAGVSQDALMESAGRNAATWILNHRRPARAVVLAGLGGNGGDGLVVARRLRAAGIAVQTYITALPSKGSATARMAQRLAASGAAPAPILESWDELDSALANADVIVDALFGSGVTRPLEHDHAKIVDRINAAHGLTVSLDLPSGLAADQGTSLGASVCADVTLAMAFLKPAHVLYPAAARCGQIDVVDVAYPPRLLNAVSPWAHVLESRGVSARLPDRPPHGHKGTFGRVLVVAGSIGMTGAAMLCCRGALRAGAGLVYLAIPASLDPILESALPEVITLPIADDDGHLRSTDTSTLRDPLRRCDVLAIGPGLTRRPGVLAAVCAIIDAFDGRLVIDADALPALKDAGRALRLAGRSVLTPHPGELARLVEKPPEAIERTRRDAARTFADASGCVVALKGRPTVIASPGAAVFVNTTGSDALATAGSGDVLTGLVAGLLAGGASPEDAAVAAAYIHGAAADLFVRHRSARSMLASDLLDLFPRAFRALES